MFGFNKGQNKNTISLREFAKKELRYFKFEKSIISFFFILTVLSLSILLIFYICSFPFTGLVSYIEARAGTITELDIRADTGTPYWTGIYGLVFMVPSFFLQLHGEYGAGEVTRQDLFFSCIQSGVDGGNEVFASPSPTINFAFLRPANVEDINEFMGCSTDRMDCASNTFTNTTEVYIGTNRITNVPSFNTYRLHGGGRELFDLGALTDGTNLVFFTHVENIETVINTSIPYLGVINFQMMLPTQREADQVYYFFVDPHDICPDQNLSQILTVDLAGRVLDQNSNPLENAEVTLNGLTDLSSATGNYYIQTFLLPGTYNLFARKGGYKNYFSDVSFSQEVLSVYRDIVLEELEEGEGARLDVSVYGKITDSVGNAVSGARIYLVDSSTTSLTDGNYNLSTALTEGAYTVIYVKEGYHVTIEYVNFSEYQTRWEANVVMSPISEYQYPTGPYTEERQDESRASSEGQTIEEILASGEDFWISTKEINEEVMEKKFIKETIGIYNSRDSPMTLNFEVSPSISSFVKIDKVAESIGSKSFSELDVTIYGSVEPGTYNGTITISGSIEQAIPVSVKILEAKYPIELLFIEVETLGEVTRPGQSLTYKISMKNLLRDQNYEVRLRLQLKDLSGEEIYYEESFNTEVSSSSSFVRKLTVPENLTDGVYLLEVQADYLEFFSTVSTTFSVSKPIYLYSFFGIPLWMMFVAISVLSFGGLNVFMYKHYADKKKRYQISLDSGTLPTGQEEKVVKMGLIAESKKPAFYELDKLTTHAVVSGATGMGKSVSAQVIIEEALLKGIAVIVFDPTAQWSGMLRKCTDKKMLALYPKFGLKPQQAQAFKGNVRMIKNVKQKIDISKYASPGQIQIFSMNKLSPAEIDIFVANVIKQIFRSDPKEYPGLKVLLVFDEVHRLLPKFGGSGEGFLQIERGCREFRKWGLGIMLISQVMNDFVGEIKANINTEFQARTIEENDLNRIRTKYGEVYLKSLIKAEIGTVMFQNADYNRGRPYFVSFRPLLHSTRRLTDEELEKYNKYNDQVDDIEFQIDALEKEKVDVFDLKMELKLIKDKIMTGSFSVVEIYLEGFVPRLKKEWEKLGKQPPERTLEVVSEEEMAEEDAKTAVERKKAEEEQNTKPAANSAEVKGEVTEAAAAKDEATTVKETKADSPEEKTKSEVSNA